MSIAILISGGLDSAILLGDTLRRGQQVHPLFVRCGLHWEEVELAYLRRYLAALAQPHLQALTILEQPVADIYGNHWSLTGRGVPDASTPDKAVFLPGRNLLLLSKALLWCHLHGVAAVALGALEANPFPDATPEPFRAVEALVHVAVGGQVHVSMPFADLKKPAVMQFGQGLPLEHTFSCIQPAGELHCGRCNKCAERRRAFAAVHMADPTHYSQTRP